MKILIIHGPNLNLLGLREPIIYGTKTQNELIDFVKARFLDIKFSFFQSNHEGEIIDKIHESMNTVDALIINPGAFAHYSYAIRDAISSVKALSIEVHLSDIMNREDFRKISVLKDVCEEQIYGLGKNSYIEALKILETKYESS